LTNKIGEVKRIHTNSTFTLKAPQIVKGNGENQRSVQKESLNSKDCHIEKLKKNFEAKKQKNNNTEHSYEMDERKSPPRKIKVRQTKF